jgi:hypothetical protein
LYVLAVVVAVVVDSQVLQPAPVAAAAAVEAPASLVC